VRDFINATVYQGDHLHARTTEAINLSLFVGPPRTSSRAMIVLTVLEHHSNIVPWHDPGRGKGATSSTSTSTSAASSTGPVPPRARTVAEARSFRPVSNALAPSTRRWKWSRGQGCRRHVLVDGAQGAPHQGVDVRALGCDFYAFSGHKMLGPTGPHPVRPAEQLEAMDPFMSGAHMIKTVARGHDLPRPAWKFEAARRRSRSHRPGAAIDYLSELAWKPSVARAEITNTPMRRWSEIEGLTVYASPRLATRRVISFALEASIPTTSRRSPTRDQVCLRAGHHCAMPLMTRSGSAATARASFLYLFAEG